MDYSEELQYRKKRRRFRVVASVFLFLFVVLMSGGAYLFFYTDTFYFTHIEIMGLKNLKKEDVLAKNKISFFEGINLKNPLIKTSVINRDYIYKKLDIALEEREPYAIWCRSVPQISTVPTAPNAEVATSTASSTVSSTVINSPEMPSDCYWFDKDGFIFAGAPETEGVLLLEVEDISLREIKIGEYVLPDDERTTLFKIFNFIDVLNIKVRQFRLEPLDKQEVTAFTEAGPMIYFSLRLDPSFAIEPVRSLKATLPTLKYVDLRSENKVFYR
ncbi:MAG: hypothetical protein Q8P97_00890 [bacterium]|nr:hypothetical protein [bacterium]